jgi:glycosyltransferase involved in cell wall biosynthesis
MKICHVCNAHTVDDGRVFHRACVGLAKAGYDVHLLAVGQGEEPYSAKGVTIHPLPRCPNRKQRFSRRSLVARMAIELMPDLIHVHEPELLGPVIACAQSRPVVYDVHESYLDVLKERQWIPDWLRSFVRFGWDRWETRLLRQCAGVVVVTERIAQRYRQLHNKVEVVSNYPDLSELTDLPAVTRNGRTCVFAGGLTADRGLSQVLIALSLLNKRSLPVPLALAGPAAPNGYLHSLWEEAKSLGIRELIQYHGVLARHDAVLLQHRSSIGLVPYLPVANSMASMANKLLECMALGLPVVFSDFPNYREVAGVSGAGLPVDPTKPENIADAIERLICNHELARSMGEAGMRAVRERFNWGIERAKLLGLYHEILG